ncbi:MAG TPA: hemagglutinin repeat-containing protein, partial [Rhodocyclaceae bacterium]|nr:hemagglutinin repeat-containing protein [Rhodocyclaceae bacterium]
THLQAGQDIDLRSGGDTTIKGAVGRATKISLEVGSNLNVESLQDHSKFNDKQENIGGSITIGNGVAGGNFSYSKSKTDSDFASVTEQSGLRAGDQGFYINVENNITLIGGAITSTQKAVSDNKNTLKSGGKLVMIDIQNRASYKASGLGVSAGTGIRLDGKLAPQGTSAGFSNNNGNTSSTTTATISDIAGNGAARTGEAETGITKIFDPDKTETEIYAQMLITQSFGREASKAVANYAEKKIEDIKTQQISDTNKATPNIEQLQSLKGEQQKWEEGGAYRIGLHATVGGLTGGVQGALGGGAAASAAPILNIMQDTLSEGLKYFGANTNTAKSAAQFITSIAATGIGGIASGGSITGAATAFNSDSNNRQLSPTEKQRIKEIAKNDPRMEARLTAAACAMVHCYSEYPEGSQAYKALQAMAVAGASDALAAERQILLLERQQDLFGYTTSGLLNDQYIDSARRINSTYQITTRALGAGQTILGVWGVTGAFVAAPVSCATGIGCLANGVVATFSADAAYAGAKQMTYGQSESTFLYQALRGFGLSPDAASYAELALGLGAAAKAGSSISSTTDRAMKLNDLARASYSDFIPNGVRATPEVMNSPQIQSMIQELRAGSPALNIDEARNIVAQWVQSGSTLPTATTAAPGNMLIKAVPKGEIVTPYTPYWMSPEQSRAIAIMTPEQAGKALGLPAEQAWKIISNGLDFYFITPKTGTTPKVFSSDIASTGQGKVSNASNAQQILVPNRSYWTEPKPINPLTLRQESLKP